VSCASRVATVISMVAGGITVEEICRGFLMCRRRICRVSAVHRRDCAGTAAAAAPILMRLLDNDPFPRLVGVLVGRAECARLGTGGAR
jgi:hypothetical protein